jgi:hypothetical protein
VLPSPDFFDRVKRDNLTKYHVKRLQKLGYEVDLGRATPA